MKSRRAASEAAGAVHHRARSASRKRNGANSSHANSFASSETRRSFSSSERLGLRIPRLEELLEESEPLEIDGLAKYHFEQELLTHALCTASRSNRFCRCCAPAAHCRPARRAMRICAKCATRATNLRRLVRQHVNQTAAETREVQLALGEFELSARIDQLHRRSPRSLPPNDAETEGPARHLDRSSDRELRARDRVDPDHRRPTKSQPVLETFAPIEKEEAREHLAATCCNILLARIARAVALFPAQLARLCRADAAIRRARGSPRRNGADEAWRHSPKPGRPTKASDRNRRTHTSASPFAMSPIRSMRVGKIALAVFVPAVKSRAQMKPANDFDLLRTQIGEGTTADRGERRHGQDLHDRRARPAAAPRATEPNDRSHPGHDLYRARDRGIARPHPRAAASCARRVSHRSVEERIWSPRSCRCTKIITPPCDGSTTRS